MRAVQVIGYHTKLQLTEALRREEVLRGRLAVLDRRALLSIVRAFELIEPTELDLDALNETSLIDLIVAAVRKRLAAD